MGEFPQEFSGHGDRNRTQVPGRQRTTRRWRLGSAMRLRSMAAFQTPRWQNESRRRAREGIRFGRLMRLVSTALRAPCHQAICFLFDYGIAFTA
jgi:hypothetical protein